MSDDTDRWNDTATSAEDEAFIAGARRVVGFLRHPVAIGILAIAGAAAIFRMGVTSGEVVYGAFDGDGMMAAVFGATFVAVLVAIIAVGVVLDRRARDRDATAAPLTGAQRERLRAYAQPASPLVRWYQPAAIVVFLALAAPGALLLDAPWDGVWVLLVLVGNPLVRWLRAQGHVLTTRDLGFPIPGLSRWPSIANAALAATAGMAVAVLLWAEALDTTLATTVTGVVLISIIVGGGAVIDRHQRRHSGRLVAERPS